MSTALDARANFGNALLTCLGVEVRPAEIRFHVRHFEGTDLSRELIHDQLTQRRTGAASTNYPVVRDAPLGVVLVATVPVISPMWTHFVSCARRAGTWSPAVSFQPSLTPIKRGQ